MFTQTSRASVDAAQRRIRCDRGLEHVVDCVGAQQVDRGVFVRDDLDHTRSRPGRPLKKRGLAARTIRSPCVHETNRERAVADRRFPIERHSD